VDRQLSSKITITAASKEISQRGSAEREDKLECKLPDVVCAGSLTSGSLNVRLPTTGRVSATNLNLKG
jgi:hypothetical protein